MKTTTHLFAAVALAIGTLLPALAQTPSTLDLWDISQGSIITSNTPLDANSDIRDMFGGSFSSVDTGYTRFQNGQPTNFVHAVEWQTPYFTQVTNFNLFLSPDPGGSRDIGSFNLYAFNGNSFQLIFSTNGVPTYTSPIIISANVPALTANRWRAEFTPVAIGPNNGPRIAELDGFGTIVPPPNVPSDGSDGALNVTSNTVIDLSQAVTGTWTNNNTANAGQGVYDPSKWAVVFKYSSVNVSNGATLTFLNHPTHAPVVWLVQSNVTINGTVSLNGVYKLSTFPTGLVPAEPGPGGFRSGAAGPTGNSFGYGPGADINSDHVPTQYASSYGNPQILPLIGGSGGYADGLTGMGSGGGAILIAAGNSVTIGGSITAKGAVTEHHPASDGAVRIIANQILGTGAIDVSVDGRTRMEANSLSPQLNIFPDTIAVPPGTTPAIWPLANAPIVTVVSVNGQASPADPLAGVSTSPDLSISTNNPVDIILQTQNFPPNGAVSVRVNPKYGPYLLVNASYVSGTFTQATWKATTTLPQGFCVLQAHATSQ